MKKGFQTRCILATSTVCLLTMAFTAFAEGKLYFPSGYYISGGAYAGMMKADGFKASGTLASNYIVNQKDTDRNAISAIGAIGYVLESFPVRFALEYAYRPELKYSNNKVFNGSTTQQGIHSTVSNQAIFLTGYLDWNSERKATVWMPFLKVGAGGAYHKTQMTLMDSNGNTPLQRTKKSKNNFDLAWEAGVGIRYRVTNNFFLSFAYQYVNLGKATWGPWTLDGQSAKLEDKNTVSNEVLLTLDIFFGNQNPKIPQLIGAMENKKEVALLSDGKPKYPPSLINDEARSKDQAPSLMNDDESVKRKVSSLIDDGDSKNTPSLMDD